MSADSPPADSRRASRGPLIAAGLVLTLVTGFGLGRLTSGDGTSSAVDTSTVGGALADHTHPPGATPHAHPTGGATGTTGAGSGADATGLSRSAAGYLLVPTTTTFSAGEQQDFRFRIIGADRKPVSRFAVVHEKPLHMIVVRRDLSGYQHLHPTMAADGTWSVPLTLAEPGVWRAYTDFTALDEAGTRTAVTLGVDLVVAGDHTPRALPTPARETTVDGLTVGYQGTPQVGAVQPLLFTVSAGGRPVSGLEPYLGAYGHLVALREGDLGYLHVHPEPELAAGAVKFWLAAPSPGTYRLYFDFKVGGAVRTAEFTVTLA